MILFTILLSIIIAIAVIATIVILIARGSLFPLFGDLLAFRLIVWLSVKMFRKK